MMVKIKFLALLFLLSLIFIFFSGCIQEKTKSINIDRINNNKTDCINNCRNDRCDGYEFYECVTGSDDCKRESYIGLLIGNCGVECIESHECPEGHSCKNYSCTRNEKKSNESKKMNLIHDYHEKKSNEFIIKFDNHFDAIALIKSGNGTKIVNIINGSVILNDEGYCNARGDKNITLMMNEEEANFYWNLSDIKCEETALLKISNNDLEEINRPTSDRWPHNLITPDKVSHFISYLKFTNDTINDLNLIRKYVDSRLRYRFDFVVGAEWTPPAEALKEGYGDCEEWGTSFVSLAKSYKNDIKCYVMIFSRHVNAFCMINNKFAIFDQQTARIFTKKGTTKKEQAYSIKNQFTKYKHNFGMDSHDVIEAIFDEDEFHSFANEMDFYYWIIQN